MTKSDDQAVERLTREVERRRVAVAQRKATVEREYRLLAQEEHDLALAEQLLMVACGGSDISGAKPEIPRLPEALTEYVQLERELKQSKKIRSRVLAILKHRGERPTTTPEIVDLDAIHSEHLNKLNPNSVSSLLSKLSGQGIVEGDGAGHWWIAGNRFSLPKTDSADVMAGDPESTGAFSHQSGDEDSNFQKRELSAPAEESGRKRILSPQRQLADELVGETVLDQKGRERVLTEVEMQRRIMKTLGVSRRVAQSAVRKSLLRYDPRNPDRLTRPATRRRREPKPSL